MNPTTADTTQILNALPPQWHGVASLVVQGGVLLVFVGHFIATHGGVRGIWKVLLDGKDGKI